MDASLLCVHTSPRVPLRAAKVHENSVYHVIITISTWQVGRSLEYKGLKGPLKTSDFWVKMPIFDTNCFQIRFQLQMALTKQQDLGKCIIDHDAPLRQMGVSSGQPCLIIPGCSRLVALLSQSNHPIGQCCRMAAHA